MKLYRAIIETKPIVNNGANEGFTPRTEYTVAASSLHVAFNRAAYRFTRDFGQMATHYVSITVNPEGEQS